jgi:hypothetical protein
MAMPKTTAKQQQSKTRTTISKPDPLRPQTMKTTDQTYQTTRRGDSLEEV